MLRGFVFQDNFCSTIEHTFSQDWILCRVDILQSLPCLLLGEYIFINCLYKQNLYMLMKSVFCHCQFVGTFTMKP